MQPSVTFDLLPLWLQKHMRRRAALRLDAMAFASFSRSSSWKADVAQQTPSEFLSQSPSVERHENLDSTLLQLNPGDGLIVLTSGVISVAWCVCGDWLAWACCACLLCKVAWGASCKLDSYWFTGRLGGLCVLFPSNAAFWGASVLCDLPRGAFFVRWPRKAAGTGVRLSNVC